jgi:hypothetical protein
LWWADPLAALRHRRLRHPGSATAT